MKRCEGPCWFTPLKLKTCMLCGHPPRTPKRRNMKVTLNSQNMRSEYVDAENDPTITEPPPPKSEQSKFPPGGAFGPEFTKFYEQTMSEVEADTRHNDKTAQKHDAEKPDMSLLTLAAKTGIAKAFMDGEKKYGRYNYLSGMEWTRLLAAADRHLSAFNDGEDCAKDSGLNHLYHAGACICMLIEYFEKSLGTDNRYKK